MLHQTNPFIYKLRFLAAGLLIAASLFLLVTFVSGATAGAVTQAGNTSQAGSAYEGDDNPNVVAGGFSDAASAIQQAVNTAGARADNGFHSVALASVRSGRFAAHSSIAVASITSHSILSAARAEAGATMYMLRLPYGLASISRSHLPAVSDLIRPPTTKPVPVISAETSAAILAHYNAQQQQEIAKLQATQLAANRSLGGSVVAGDPNHGGYPAKWDDVSQDSTLDSWGMYNRECVSYAAWKVFQTYGYMPNWGGVGNANEWVGDAKAAGIPTGSTPQVHSVAISMHGYYGHAMWVEAVSGDMIYVSQYNYDLQGHYSEMWVNGSAFTYIYFK